MVYYTNIQMDTNSKSWKIHRPSVLSYWWSATPKIWLCIFAAREEAPFGRETHLALLYTNLRFVSMWISIVSNKYYLYRLFLRNFIFALINRVYLALKKVTSYSFILNVDFKFREVVDINLEWIDIYIYKNGYSIKKLLSRIHCFIFIFLHLSIWCNAWLKTIDILQQWFGSIWPCEPSWVGTGSGEKK